MLSHMLFGYKKKGVTALLQFVHIWKAQTNLTSVGQT